MSTNRIDQPAAIGSATELPHNYVVIVHASFEENEQLEIMDVLAVMQCNRTLYPPSTLPTDADKEMMPILNWIAFAFLGKITLYLTMNRGYPEKAEEDNGVEFLKVLRNALRSFEQGGTISQVRGNRQNAVDPHTACAEKPITVSVDAYFDQLVMAWTAAASGHHEKHRILRLVRTYDCTNAVLPDGNAALRFTFATLISVIKEKKAGERDELYVFRDVNDQMKFGARLCHLALSSVKRVSSCVVDPSRHGDTRHHSPATEESDQMPGQDAARAEPGYQWWFR
ncbi:hypothetical protein BU15DRAFT_70582 [Melanogaster broomeanus]|nr:hypothetical protein BU15DRAFT_70582 [Melanogaster broomeanus]